MEKFRPDYSAYGPYEQDGALLGANALNPWHRGDSSPRGAMISSHLSQSLVIDGATERAQQTGYEREYGKYTFDVSMPCNGRILEIIDRYEPSLGVDSINKNPQTIVIYENLDTGQLGMLSLTEFCTNHQYFGFKYVPGPAMMMLRQGAEIPKGAVFLRSPNVRDNGGYSLGVEANIAFMTHPAVSEDGVLIRKGFLPTFGIRTFEFRVGEWGQKQFALNLYGTDSIYKPHPDIGEMIRPDGILMAFRRYGDNELAALEQSIYSTRHVQYPFDRTIYANGPGGVVVDIKYHHDKDKWNHAETHMDRQAQKYDRARRVFYERIMEVWRKYFKKMRENLNLTPELHRLMLEAHSVVSEGNGQRVSKLYRKVPLDDYRVEFTIEYRFKPNVGFKLSGLHGNKGVICQLAEDEHMPVDADGNRADIVMDPNSTFARMNMGVLYEVYVNGASRETHKKLSAMLGLRPMEDEEIVQAHLQSLPDAKIQEAMDFLTNYYAIVSPKMSGWIDEGVARGTEREYLTTVVSKGITLYMPTNNPVDTQRMVQYLEKSPFKPLYGPVTYVGNSGERVTTQENIAIASSYVVLLEKIADSWSAVASSKVQHFGVPSQLTKQDKYSKPAHQQAVRGAGEAEVRIAINYVGQYYVAELMDRNNNPHTHRLVVDGLLRAPYPTNVQNLVDRKMYPFGGVKPMQLVSHLSQCAGYRFAYRPYAPPWATPEAANVDYQPTAQ